MSEAYNPLSLAWKASLFCVHLQCLINFLQCTCHSSCWDIWEVNQYKMAVLCLSWKGKLLPSITGFLPCWTNIHNPESTYCRCKHHCASLVGSSPKCQDFGVCHHPGMEAEAIVSHHLIKIIITGSGSGARKRKKAFQSLPLHFNRSPMLYNTGEQGVNQLKNIVLHSMRCGLQLPNDLHLSSLAVEVYNWTKESLE